jgi:hypothetical protein
MDISKIRLGRANVHVEYTNEGDTYQYDSKDKPLPSFYAAMESLAPLVIATLGLPKTYIGKKPTEGDKVPGLPLTVVGISIATKGEARQVCIIATKVVSTCPSPFNITTPLRYMDRPDKEGSASEPYEPKQVELLEEVISEAKRYLNGERAQGTLPLEQTVQPPAEPEDGNQESLPGTE